MDENGAHGAALDSGVAIRFDGVSKLYKAGSTRATVPIPWPFPGGTDWRAREREPFLDDDDDEDDEIEEVEEVEEVVSDRDTWALRNITLDVEEGLSLGIIGPNGSGKTTLLKTVARITPPSEGRILVRGQVAPLLSTVSSFFAPSHTGRQNVYSLARFFNIPRAIVDRNMDEIFEFAGLSELIDVKGGAYSSGQYQRLGFSSALHLDSDILLAQDAFVIGDAAFRDRAVERLEEARAAGMTLLYASHDLEMIEKLCDEVIWMEEGKIVERGKPEQIMARWDQFRQAQKATRQTVFFADDEPDEPPDGPEAQSGDGAAEPTPGKPLPSEDCATLYEFLTVAIGEYEAGRSLERATEVAIENGSTSVGWHLLAEASGYPLAQAEEILGRLVRHEQVSRSKLGTRRVFNEHLAIVSGNILSYEGTLLKAMRADEAVWLKVFLEAASPEILVRCTIRLRSGEHEPIALEQPEEFLIVRPRSCSAFVGLPAGALQPGLYSCDVLVKIAKDQQRGAIHRRNLFEFEVYDPDPEATEDREEDEHERLEGTELEWRVKA